MTKIFKYSFFDIFRSRWMILYFLFFLLSTFMLLNFSSDLPKSIASLMNVTITIIPLISTVFGVMYYYNSRDFIDLLLCQPIKRSNVFLGLYFGLSVSLALSFGLGVLIPFLVYGVMFSTAIWDFSILLYCGLTLTFVFVGFAFFISLLNEDRIKGFGITILIWLFLAVIYDSLILLIFVSFSDYPLEKAAIFLSIFNPIDLSRILILLQLDVSALMGYTGAVFNMFFGTFKGMMISAIVLLIWIVSPLFFILKIAKKKDF